MSRWGRVSPIPAANATRSATTKTEHLGPPQILAPLDDLRDLSTNHASQWSLNLIEVLALAKDATPATLPGYWQS